ncbi:MAG: Carbamoyl-phosphate synthase large chain [candidate division Zixibacteria bacterium RBG-1]|nr:MAG: Carbamoyl-phosphate synthase large chain [candidate division Zixibacteria bacterium RBG-1]OGC84625.1 MAG: carbamoyl phosphate synthase large subunit [candidate division Zixibacteria bacterium RBG_19FT_COMBO_42_43]
MPKRKDIQKILIIGSGPIVIGQACEFDYSGTQACKALREEGYKIILVNNNPATIMTDPETADRTYLEPLTPFYLEKIITHERPQAILPTLGGQTGLNLAMALAEQKILKKYQVELIGARYETIKICEDRLLFKQAMQEINLEVPKSGLVFSVKQAEGLAKKIGFPVVVRPSFTLGGAGGGVAYNLEELQEIVARGLEQSPVKSVLIEESALGWKEFELEVMRDINDNVVIVCSIENFDPMGVHTGDSITVAPAQTLTDKEYQKMRDAAIAIMRKVGVETGGSNIQFAIQPETGRMVVIEMNPRVSRSSALASKATGFPIAKIAAQLAVGYTLDEIPNDITKKTPACFEPSIDYVVVKAPRFDFEKFPEADSSLTTQMKSVGESMAFGRTFKEALQKALRALEAGYIGLCDKNSDSQLTKEQIIQKLKANSFERIFQLKNAFQIGMTINELYHLTKIDRWFLHQIQQIVELENQLQEYKEETDLFKKPKKEIPRELFLQAKKCGFSDRQLALLWNKSEDWVRRKRGSLDIKAVVKTVDTCAGEFEAFTPYYYCTFETEDETVLDNKQKKVVILGSGPNRIGQGIEFDYACVQACLALRQERIKTIMVNCNPETVSTDYDISDKLYFEPLTLEDVLNIIEKEQPWGVLIQFGGQTPLKLAVPLEKHGVKILGTSPFSIDIAEDREKFSQLLRKLALLQPPGGIARSESEAIQIAKKVSYPVLVRPSYVLGGQAMQLVYAEEKLKEYVKKAFALDNKLPLLIDKFLEDAVEVDVDALCDGEEVFVGGIMEHIEEAGIHSGDSACVLPAFSLSEDVIKKIEEHTAKIALALKVKGLLNIQFALKDDEIYVLEVNPRASRTVPFVSKAIGIPLAQLAAKISVGKKLKQILPDKLPQVQHFSVKMPVFPFIKFPGVDYVLGPKMQSTGEVMGIDADLGKALAKGFTIGNQSLPISGTVFLSVKNKDKRNVVYLAKEIADLGFKLIATRGTAKVLKNSGIVVEEISKVHEGRPNVIDRMKNKEIGLVINTPSGEYPQKDSYIIRRTAIELSIPCITTLWGAYAAINAIEKLKKESTNGGLGVKALQDYFKLSEASSSKIHTNKRIKLEKTEEVALEI